MAASKGLEGGKQFMVLGGQTTRPLEFGGWSLDSFLPSFLRWVMKVRLLLVGWYGRAVSELADEIIKARGICLLPSGNRLLRK